MKIISSPPKWSSAYEPIEYVLTKEIPLAVNDTMNTVGIIGSTNEPLYCQLECFSVGGDLCEIGDLINITYSNGGEPIFDRDFIVRAIDVDNEPILDTLIADVTTPSPISGYYATAVIKKKAAKTFKLYAGYPSWHPKFSVRDINTLVATIILEGDLNFDYKLRVESFLQGLLDNPAPIIGDDDKMYIGFKLKCIDEGLETEIGGVKYCLNATTQSLNSSSFATSLAPLTDYPGVKVNTLPVLTSKIIDDSVINQLL
jgi:hypothetical protein